MVLPLLKCAIGIAIRLLIVYSIYVFFRAYSRRRGENQSALVPALGETLERLGTFIGPVGGMLGMNLGPVAHAVEEFGEILENDTMATPVQKSAPKTGALPSFSAELEHHTHSIPGPSKPMKEKSQKEAAKKPRKPRAKTNKSKKDKQNDAKCTPCKVVLEEMPEKENAAKEKPVKAVKPKTGRPKKMTKNSEPECLPCPPLDLKEEPEEECPPCKCD